MQSMTTPNKILVVLLTLVVVLSVAFHIIDINGNAKEVNNHPCVVYAEEKTEKTLLAVSKTIEKINTVSDEDIDLIALITMAEAEGETELGKRLVIDTILNRVDSDASYFPDTIYDVIYQKNAFESVWNGRIDRCYVMDDIRQLVLEELENRTNYDVVYFTAGDYNEYGTPLFQEDNHYFSGH